MRADGTVAMLAPMPLELRAVVRVGRLRRDGELAGRIAHRGVVGGVPVVAVACGMGTTRSERVTADVLAGGDVSHVLVVGVAGAVGAHHPLGAAFHPEEVADARTGARYRPHALGADRPTPRSGTLLTGDDFITDPDHLDALARDGVTALDMETAAVAAVCEGAGVPWSVARAISDVAGDEAVVATMEHGLARPDGTPDVAAAVRFLARAPWRVGSLTRLARQAQAAARSAAREAVRAVESST